MEDLKRVVAYLKKNINVSHRIDSAITDLSAELKASELSERFGIPEGILTYVGSSYAPFDYGLNLALHSAYHLTNSDTGERPEKGEWVLAVTFPTGAYIFGDQYDTKTFGDFFGELKAFNHKYSDTLNRTLLFSPEQSKKLLPEIEGIVGKYVDIAKAECLKLKRAKLEAELKALKESE